MVLILSLAGMALLLWGANRLVDGASSLASRWGVSRLVIGLTVVALGTSAPELAVSVTSAYQGKGDLAIGNVVGSNLCNILLILGLSGLVTPLVISYKTLRFDVPVMIAAALAVVFFGRDGKIGMFEGLALIAVSIAYIAFSVLRSRQNCLLGTPAELPANCHSASRSLGLVVLGLVCLVVGSHWMVEGATALARLLGFSELVIGLTVVAVGTSLPEIATSITAGLRGQRDIAIGNVVGSNILNVLVILGSSAVAAGSDGLAVSAGVREIDGPLMLIASIACVPLFWSGYTLARLEALVLLVGYVLYTTWCLTGTFSGEVRQVIKVMAICYGFASIAMMGFLFAYRRSSIKRVASVSDPIQ